VSNDEAVEAFVRDVLAECTAKFVVELERQKKSGEHKDLTSEAIRRWRAHFDATVGKHLRKGTLEAAQKEWDNADEGGKYVLKNVGRIARKAYDESGFGWQVDDQDVTEAFEYVRDKAHERFDRMKAKNLPVPRKKWCEV
jgi:hypothetical protein